MLTDTWLTPFSDATISECTPDGYSLLHRDRSTKTGGGVAVISRDSLGCTEVRMSHGSTFESLVVRPSDPKMPLIIVIYRPPSSPVAQFFSDFSDLLTQVLLSNRPVTLAGDFNIHVDDLKDPTTKTFLDILSVFGLSQHIKDSTHCGGHTLDLLITHDVVPDAISVSPLTLSDHCSVSFSLPNTPKPLSSTTIRRRRTLNPTDIKKIHCSCPRSRPTYPSD